MVSNIDIDIILKPLSNYAGCYALDDINLVTPDYMGNNVSSFIVNTFEGKYRYGGHWLLVTFFNDRSGVEVFDSLGLSILIPNKIIRALSRFGTVQCTSPSLQNPFSDFCGYYVMARCISISNGQSLEKFYSNFTSDLHLNDTLVKKEIIEYVNNN